MADRAGIDAFLYLMDEAFRGAGDEPGDQSQALLPNLRSVGAAIWRELPPGGSRSIESIALHVGTCKLMYDDYAFGGAKLAWDQLEVQPWPEGSAPMAETLAWLEGAHARLRANVAALESDAELDAVRLANWGERRATRWLIGVLINHDAYHAGEINHLRSILGPDDRWAHSKAGY